MVKDTTLHILTATFFVRGSGQTGDVYHKCTKAGEMPGVIDYRINTIDRVEQEVKPVAPPK